MGLDNLNGWELVVIVLIGLFIFGPDRLPKLIGDGVRMLKTLREMARNATSDLSRELGTHVELEDLHPKTFLRKHLLSEADEEAIRKPLKDVYGDVQNVTDSFRDTLQGSTDGDATDRSPTTGASTSDAPVRETAARAGGRSQQFDDDAT
ncbi:MAG TPA: Sec-independent protein translocase subunit TatB [Micromonosporaceae bacterium]|nr:Sec-independent protein translocase subunit TatB [Micromonosporaceae bacterium]